MVFKLFDFKSNRNFEIKSKIDGSPFNNSCFDDDWLFQKGDVPGAEESKFDAASWRKIDLPHDWSIEDLPVEDNLPSISISEGEWKFKMGDDSSWKNPAFDDNDWKKVMLPEYWTDYPGHKKSGSFGWYRKEIKIPDEYLNKDFLLNIGRIADSDETYFNGVRIGGTGNFPPKYRYSYYELSYVNVRSYRVPAHLVRKDHNIVSVRVYCHNDKGGIYASAPTPENIGPFSIESPGGGSTGHTIGGIGWYRKEFNIR